MPISPRRFALPAFLALSLLSIVPAPAALVEYSGGGLTVETQGPAPDALSADARASVRFSFVFDTTRGPIVTTDTAATYAAFSATADWGPGTSVTLRHPTLMVVREPSDGDYLYLLEGTTPEGWVISYFVESPDPEFVTSLALPQQRPVDHDDYWAAILVRGPSSSWSAYSDRTDLFTVRVTPDPRSALPEIEAQPEAVAAAWGGSATFSVRCAQVGNLRYQWQKDGVAIVGATSDTLRLRRVLPHHVGSYRVVVTNAAGSVTSEPATLALHRPPIIVQQPASVALKARQAAQLMVNVWSPEPVKFQWLKDGTALPGETDKVLRLRRTSASQAGRYQVVVSNSQGAATSQAAIVTVIP